MDWLQFARFIGPTLQVIQRYLSRHLADQQAGRSTLPCEYLSSCSDGERTTRTSDFRLHQCTCCCTHLTAAGGPGGKHVVVRNETLACPPAGSCSSSGRRHSSAPSLQHRAAMFATLLRGAACESCGRGGEHKRNIGSVLLPGVHWRCSAPPERRLDSSAAAVDQVGKRHGALPHTAPRCTASARANSYDFRRLTPKSTQLRACPSTASSHQSSLHGGGSLH